MELVLQAPIVRLVPKIKGVFVNSHVEAVRQQLGDEGVAELERRFGRSVRFRATEDVAVSDEVRLIEHALDLVSPHPVAAADRAFEAGRLHFRNFSTTSYARVLFALFPANFRFMMLHARTVAERVFKGIRVEVRETGRNSLQLRMQNADYPLDHFRGLFHEWILSFGLKGRVQAQDLGDGNYVYDMEWSR